MSVFSAAERLSAIDRSQVRLDAARCLHSSDRFSGCTACFDFCPLGAIRAGKPPALDEAACANCLACLEVCPTGAYSADDSFAALLNCAARLELDTLEISCQAHPQPGFGPPALGRPPAETTSIQVRGCLAALGAGTYLALLSLGIPRITLRLDACQECKLEPLRERVRAHLREARQLAAAWGWEQRLEEFSDLPAPGWTERSVYDAHNPPISRRDLFRMASRQGQIAAARAMAEGQAPTGKRLPRARGRVVIALSKIDAPRLADPALDGLGYAALSAGEACTACGACARICPTGALSKPVADDQYRLTFSAPACTACGSCLHVCLPEALSLDPATTFSQVFGEPGGAALLLQQHAGERRSDEPTANQRRPDGPASDEPHSGGSLSGEQRSEEHERRAGERVLRAGALAKCSRCGALYAARPGEKYCPLCAFRIKNPFGQYTPPGMRRP